MAEIANPHRTPHTAPGYSGKMPQARYGFLYIFDGENIMQSLAETTLTVTVAGREWLAEPPGFRWKTYTMMSGVKTYKGVRLPTEPDIIVVLDHSNRYIGAFRESTRREVTR
jgi:hypothetical protein